MIIQCHVSSVDWTKNERDIWSDRKVPLAASGARAWPVSTGSSPTPSLESLHRRYYVLESLQHDVTHGLGHQRRFKLSFWFVTGKKYILQYRSGPRIVHTTCSNITVTPVAVSIVISCDFAVLPALCPVWIGRKIKRTDQCSIRTPVTVWYVFRVKVTKGSQSGIWFIVLQI